MASISSMLSTDLPDNASVISVLISWHAYSRPILLLQLPLSHRGIYLILHIISKDMGISQLGTALETHVN